MWVAIKHMTLAGEKIAPKQRIPDHLASLIKPWLIGSHVQNVPEPKAEPKAELKTEPNVDKKPARKADKPDHDDDLDVGDLS